MSDDERGRNGGGILTALTAVVVVLALAITGYVLVTGETTPKTFIDAAADRITSDDGAPNPDGDASTTSTAPEATTTTVPPGPTEITLAFAGDVLPHTAVHEAAASYASGGDAPYDYSPMFEPVAPIFTDADVAICHMEVPLAPEGEQITSYPSFGAPPELVTGVHSAGFDGCSTASNHSLDRGRAGLDRLLDTFDAHEMLHNGTARTEEEGDGRATVYEVEGVQVAHLSWSYDFNGYRIPEDAPWSVNQIDTERILARSSEARSEGADLVVVSLHWCCEYHHDPNAEQERIAGELMASPDVDLIIGHHAHVVQPISKVNDKFVVWGLGNQVSNQTQLERRDGLSVRVHASAGADGSWSITGVDAIPTFVDLPAFRILPVAETLAAGTEGSDLVAQLQASYDRTKAVLDRRPTEGVTISPRP